MNENGLIAVIIATLLGFCLSILFPLLALVLGLFLIFLCRELNSKDSKYIDYSKTQNRWLYTWILAGLALLLLLFSGYRFILWTSELSPSQEEKQRLEKAANVKVVNRVYEAKVLWCNGNTNEAKRKLEVAEKIPHATNLSPVKDYRAKRANEKVLKKVEQAKALWKHGETNTAMNVLDAAMDIKNATHTNTVEECREKIANARAKSILQKVIIALNKGELDLAESTVQEILSIPRATRIKKAKQIDHYFVLLEDPGKIRDTVESLSDGALYNFKQNITVPDQFEQFTSGYEELDRRISNTVDKLVIDEIERREAKKERERQKRLAKRRKRQEEARRRREAEKRRKEKERRDDAAATTLCHLYLKKRVRAPGTIDWPFWNGPDVKYYGDGKYKVTGYFDAENAFGGEVRKYYTARLHEDENGNWEINSFKFH